MKIMTGLLLIFLSLHIAANEHFFKQLDGKTFIGPEGQCDWQLEYRGIERKAYGLRVASFELKKVVSKQKMDQTRKTCSYFNGCDGKKVVIKCMSSGCESDDICRQYSCYQGSLNRSLYTVVTTLHPDGNISVGFDQDLTLHKVSAEKNTRTCESN